MREGRGKLMRVFEVIRVASSARSVGITSKSCREFWKLCRDGQDVERKSNVTRKFTFWMNTRGTCCSEGVPLGHVWTRVGGAVTQKRPACAESQ